MDEQKREMPTCTLLTPQENRRLRNQVGADCVAICFAIVEVCYAHSPISNPSAKQFAGVAAFIKDFSKKSYYIRVFDVKAGLLMEQELKLELRYQKKRPNLHTFERGDCQVALKFASEKEAELLWTAYVNWRDRAAKHSGKGVRTKATAGPTVRVTKPPAPLQPHRNAKPIPGAPTHRCTSNLRASSSMPNLKETNELKKVQNNKDRPKMTKDDIGPPMDFCDINHVGRDMKKGLSMTSMLDEKIKSFFQQAGITEDMMKVEEMRNLVYGIFELNGDLEAGEKEALAAKHRRQPGANYGDPAQPPTQPIYLQLLPASPPSSPVSSISESFAPPPPLPPRARRSSASPSRPSFVQPGRPPKPGSLPDPPSQRAPRLDTTSPGSSVEVPGISRFSSHFYCSPPPPSPPPPHPPSPPPPPIPPKMMSAPPLPALSRPVTAPAAPQPSPMAGPDVPPKPPLPSSPHPGGAPVDELAVLRSLIQLGAQLKIVLPASAAAESRGVDQITLNALLNEILQRKKANKVEDGGITEALRTAFASKK